MGKLYLSPKVRLNPAQFLQGAILLIVINFIFSLLTLALPMFFLISMPIGLIMIWLWFSLWARRLHDAGKSAWMVLLVLLVTVVAGFLSTRLVYMATGFDQATAAAAVQKAGTDIMAAMMASFEASRSIVLASAIANAVTAFMIAFFGNKLLKSDPEENQFGPVSG